MKKPICFLTIFFLLLKYDFSQTINLNPDPNGEPWTVSTQCPNTASCSTIDFIPNPASLNKPLPVNVHNELQIWWPYNTSQGGYNACVQVAEISYTYTYEINRKLNLDAGDDPLQYPDRNYDFMYGYTQNVVGVNTDSPWHSGFCLLRDNGCPTYADFQDANISNSLVLEDHTSYWMTGNSKYENGMQNRIGEIYKFPFGVNISSLNYLKHWIADHGKGENSGGLAVIGVYFANHTTTIINTPGYVNEVLLNLGTFGCHALTIVGCTSSKQFAQV